LERLQNQNLQMNKKFETGNKNTEEILVRLKESFEKKFGDENGTFKDADLNRMTAELNKKFESKEWNQKMAELSGKMATLSQELNLKLKDFKPQFKAHPERRERPEIPEKPEQPERLEVPEKPELPEIPEKPELPEVK
jgi:hypothetical protein